MYLYQNSNLVFARRVNTMVDCHEYRLNADVHAATLENMPIYYLSEVKDFTNPVKSADIPVIQNFSRTSGTFTASNCIKIKLVTT